MVESKPRNPTTEVLSADTTVAREQTLSIARSWSARTRVESTGIAPAVVVVVAVDDADQKTTAVSAPRYL